MGLINNVNRFISWKNAVSDDIRDHSTEDFDYKNFKKLKDSIIKHPLEESKKRIVSKSWFETADWVIKNDPYFRYSPIAEDIKMLLSMKKEIKDRSKESVYGVNLANSLVENRISDLINDFCNLDCWLLVGQGSIRWIDDFNKKFYE